MTGTGGYPWDPPPGAAPCGGRLGEPRRRRWSWASWRDPRRGLNQGDSAATRGTHPSRSRRHGVAQQRLTQLGLLVEERRHRRARGAVLVVGLAVLALGVLRLGQGWLAGHPIGYLTMLCVVQVFLSLGMGQTPPRATRRGEAVVARQRRAVHTWLPGESLDLRLMALAVLGVAALPAAEAAALAPLVPELAAGASDGGCGG